jgi:hypothetical protein
VGFAGFKPVRGALSVSGGFDSHLLPPVNQPRSTSSLDTTLTQLLRSHRHGLPLRSYEYYIMYLRLAKGIAGINVTGQEMNYSSR